ncbi:MAG: hypothetical protein P8104_11200 [Gammaproteobacteria bacterium]
MGDVDVLTPQLLGALLDVCQQQALIAVRAAVFFTDRARTRRRGRLQC